METPSNGSLGTLCIVANNQPRMEWWIFHDEQGKERKTWESLPFYRDTEDDVARQLSFSPPLCLSVVSNLVGITDQNNDHAVLPNVWMGKTCPHQTVQELKGENEIQTVIQSPGACYVRQKCFTFRKITGNSLFMLDRSEIGN